MNFYNEVLDVLKSDERFFSDDGQLLRNAVYEAAMQMDAKLIKALYANKETRKRFFTDVDGIAVFDKVGFGWVINNREFLPDSYTRYKNKIGLVNNKGEYISVSNDVELVFPYKDCVLEGDSTNEYEARKEIFYNTTLGIDDVDRLLSSKMFVNAKRFYSQEEMRASDFKKGENLLIKGNNLLALHSLNNIYANQIQLMYWDILYNTKSDQVPYADSFKHSSWLTMMKNRLEIARQLLKKDGTICLQCDDNEHAYLKVLCDEIFGRDKYMTTIVVKMSEPTGFKMKHADTRLPKIKEYILVYKMDYSSKINVAKIPKPQWDSEYKTILLNISKEELDYIKQVRDNDEFSENDIKKANEILKKCEYQSLSKFYKENNISQSDELNFNFENAWRIFQTVSMPSKTNKKNAIDTRNRLDQLFYFIISPQKELYIIKGDFDENVDKPRMKVVFADDYLLVNVCDMWSDIKTTGLDNEGVVDLKNGKKPEALLKRIIEIFSNENDIVLDAYVGSGTTSAVALKLNRKFIGIEQLDSHFEKAINRLKAVVSGEQSGISKEVNWQGGGSFVYCELAKLNQNYVDAIEKATTDEELTKLYAEILETGFISYKVNPKDIDVNSDAFIKLSVDDKKRLLMELLDKNQLYVNYCDMDDETFGISEEDKAFTRSFYGEV